MQTHDARRPAHPHPLLPLGLLCLALATSACGAGEIDFEWEDDTAYTDEEVNANYTAEPVDHEPEAALTVSAEEDGLTDLEGLDEDLAEWQQQHPGEDPWADDVEEELPIDREPGADDNVVTFGGCGDASGGKRGHLTMLQVGRLARKVGIRCGPRLVTAIAIAGAESANYRYRWHRNTNCTTDIGLWQINDYYHPRYAKTNVITNATGMKRISGKGRRWTAWYARNTETFRRYRKHNACDAAQKICGWKRTDNWRQRHCFCNLSSCN